MKVAFFQPPPAQRIGGLDAAIQGLRTALASIAVEVTDSPTLAPDTELAHFHGLWQPAHAKLARACRATGVPYLVSPHGMLEPWAWRHKWWKKWPYFQLVEKRYMASAATILATAPPEAERLARFTHAPIAALPLGLTGSARPDYRLARRELGWAAEEIVLLYLSRLHVKKGADLLLRALAGMKWPAVTRLVFVGDGDHAYVERIRSYAEVHAAKLPRIDWIGAVWGDARWKFFQGADLFCLPTHSENFGLAVLDALQVGTPALTTTGTPWAAELTGDRGYITAPDLAGIRGALAKFFAAPRLEPEARSEIADWALNRYAWSQLAPRYAALYAETIKRRGSPHAA